MRGSVYKRCTCPPRTDSRGRRLTCSKQHGSWYFKLDGGGPGPGRRRQLAKGGYPTKAAAEAALAEAVTSATRGPLVLAVSKARLGDYLDGWLASVRPTLEVPAWTNYAKVLELYVRPHLADVRLVELTPQRLNAVYSTLLARGGKGGRSLAPTTVRLVHRVLHKALADAVADGHLTDNPVVRAKPPRRQRAETDIWTAEQAAAFLLASRRDRLHACWLVALTCGLRRGELAGLRWKDVDFAAGTLNVAVQRTTDASTQVVSKAPKGTSRRTLDLGEDALAALRHHRDAQLRECAELGLTGPAGDLVFTREDGQPYAPQRVTELFQAAARAAGLPVIRLHDARHSCATMALAAGIHPKVVQQLLGHASWSTTMDLYTHRVERLQRDATSRIEALLRPAPAAFPSAGFGGTSGPTA